jgi:hypothetical protein
VGEVVEFEAGGGGALGFDGETLGWERGDGRVGTDAVVAGGELEKLEVAVGIGSGAGDGLAFGSFKKNGQIGGGLFYDKHGARDFPVGGVGEKRRQGRAKAPTVENEAGLGAGGVGGEGGVGQRKEGGDEFVEASGQRGEGGGGGARVGGCGRVGGGGGERALGAGEAFAQGGEFGGADWRIGGGLAPRPSDAVAFGAPLRGQENAAETGREERPELRQGAAGDDGEFGLAGFEAEFNRGTSWAGGAGLHGAGSAGPVSRVARGQR